MSQRQTIEQYQLTRVQEEPFDEHAYSFTKSFLPAPATWSSYSIRLPNTPNQPLHEYLVSLDAQAYIIATAFLQDTREPDSRLTDMRLSQMIVDSWISAGGDPGSLRFLGVNWIVNQDVGLSVAREFQHADHNSLRSLMIDGERALVVVSNHLITDNLFVKCATRVAQILSAISDHSVAVKTVSLIRLESFVVHMVMEFESKERVVVEPVATSPPKSEKVLNRKQSTKRHAIKRALSHVLRK